MLQYMFSTLLWFIILLQLLYRTKSWDSTHCDLAVMMDSTNVMGTQTFNRSLLRECKRREQTLEFLIECRTLKRPPKTLRMKDDSFRPLPTADRLQLISEIEAKALEKAIKLKRVKIQNKKAEIKALE